jgi:hypothetical protein
MHTLLPTHSGSISLKKIQIEWAYVDVVNPRPHNWVMYFQIGIIINNLEVHRPSKIKAIRQTQNRTKGLVLLHTHYIYVHMVLVLYFKKETCLREHHELWNELGEVQTELFIVWAFKYMSFVHNFFIATLKTTWALIPTSYLYGMKNGYSCQ